VDFLGHGAVLTPGTYFIPNRDQDKAFCKPAPRVSRVSGLILSCGAFPPLCLLFFPNNQNKAAEERRSPKKGTAQGSHKRFGKRRKKSTRRLGSPQ
jgi:hypothetical protein